MPVPDIASHTRRTIGTWALRRITTAQTHLVAAYPILVAARKWYCFAALISITSQYWSVLLRSTDQQYWSVLLRSDQQY
eukprot:3808897-Rhodomonas_salina.2